MLPPTFTWLDEARRWAGRALDSAGIGPVEAPFRVVAEMPGARLRAYHAPDAPAGPVLLIIPAPIKRSYIWDLLPPVSVVRHCLRRGARTFLLEWLDHDGTGEDDGPGLADYADRLPAAALDAIAAETGETGSVVLTGHSLGGTLAAVFAALHPGRVRGLALIEAPLAFGERGGPLARAVAASPHARALRGAAAGGTAVPGSLLTLLSAAAVPSSFVWRRWADLGASLPDPGALAIHARVVRWTLDEFAMPGRLFEEVVERLYREDCFAAGTLEVGGRCVGANGLRCPVLAVVSPSGRVVPPESTLAPLEARPDLLLEVLRYEGDRGPALQHLGPLVGPAAHARLWPDILDWVAACPPRARTMADRPARAERG